MNLLIEVIHMYFPWRLKVCQTNSFLLCLLAMFSTYSVADAASSTSELRVETLTMPGADLGPENPLPPLQTRGDIHAVQEGDPRVPDEIVRNIPYGHVPNFLPYTMQDRYDRQLKPRQFKVAVLENDVLRATFLLELGGRLWSLIHKPTGRELLYVNPVFQPANLAIRNAWFSGGVEWNIGMTGHCPYTCSPIFAGRATMPDGTPVLRMYEWERIRQVPYQIDAWLHEGLPVLFVRVRIQNPHEREIPMYWWSNIAVPESPETRVLVPVEESFKFGYTKGGLGLAPVPIYEGIDLTYTVNFERAIDFFFHIPDGQRKWISALDGEGKGLIQTSTDRLKGRKLFLWGQGPGGKTWQQFLSQPGQAYLEIQAGLAYTQLERIPMPARADWSWLEAYGLMEADPKQVHGQDWAAACNDVETRLENLIPRSRLDQEYERSSNVPELPLEELLHRGSGWGALESVRRKTVGEPPFCSDALIFDATSLGEQQRPWLDLLGHGAMAEVDPKQEPYGFMVQDEWQSLLENSIKQSSKANWLAWLHLGVMRYQAEDREGCRQAWENSVKEKATPWALRNLAVIAQEDKDESRAAELYLKACKMRPTLAPLAAECGRALIAAERYSDWLDLLKEFPPEIRNSGRIRLLEGQAALGFKDLKRVEKLLSEPFVIEDLREGEQSGSNLWFDYHEQLISANEGVPIDEAFKERIREKYPVPSWIDFRMSAGKPRVKKEQ